MIRRIFLRVENRLILTPGWLGSQTHTEERGPAGQRALARMPSVAVAAAVAGLLVAAGAARAAEPVAGEFLGNGKAATLDHIQVVPHEPRDGEAAYTIVLSEKDPSASQDPEHDAWSGELGSALAVSVTESGTLFSTQVYHRGLERGGFSTNVVEIEDFKLEDGKLSVRLFTEGEEDFFDDRWEVDLTLNEVPLPAGT